MKLNFGHGILLLLLLFMSGILLLVYKSGQQRIDLVYQNYYEEELKYEHQIEKERKSVTLNKEVTINYDPVEGFINIQFPSSFDHSQITGNVLLYKPDDASLDYSVNVTPGENNLQRIPTNTMVKGWWKIKINWEYEAAGYYKEDKIFVANH